MAISSESSPNPVKILVIIKSAQQDSQKKKVNIFLSSFMILYFFYIYKIQFASLGQINNTKATFNRSCTNPAHLWAKLGHVGITCIRTSQSLFFDLQYLVMRGLWREGGCTCSYMCAWLQMHVPYAILDIYKKTPGHLMSFTDRGELIFTDDTTAVFAELNPAGHHPSLFCFVIFIFIHIKIPTALRSIN